MKRNYKVASMFAGIGGICLGFKRAGADIVWANEIDKFACITYRENFGGNYLVEGDIRNISVEDIPDFDILTSGFPCQAFSIAGYQKGFKDERGHLFFETLRILEGKRPRAFFIENVKNLVSHDSGKTFRIIYDALKEAGYHIRYQVMNSMEYGNVPQNRERIYIVGFINKEECNRFYFPEPIPLTKTIDDIIDKSVKQEYKYYYDSSSKYYDALKENMTKEDRIYQLRRVYVRENKSNVCPTLTANMGTGGHNVPLIRDKYGIRKLTPRECLLFQGFPESFRIPESVSDTQLYKQAGNSVTVPVIERIALNMILVMKDFDSKRKLADESEDLDTAEIAL
ncbi:cytosine-specific methyltransferase [Tepidanaerobacter syntrophicus]|uniref:DNA cytosine methyltransferase n=1 Tax=Tepidanaerobacter syntrophicus TaxID=224999 RepID=UPI0022EE268C|nr:DNA cytosine methyltransferase [Tepidanaerobacter syntrophicus]GLI18973.1 cytosine-specific methyltransferase [Tepidanaerobacter syntrophicus]